MSCQSSSVAWEEGEELDRMADRHNKKSSKKKSRNHGRVKKKATLAIRKKAQRAPNQKKAKKGLLPAVEF